MNAVNHSRVGRGLATIPTMDPGIQIDAASSTVTTSDNMKRPLLKTAAFSLVEVTLALGIAAFCLIAVLGLLPTSLKTQQASIQQTTANQIISTILSLLRADVRLPPGQANKVCGDDGSCEWGNLHGHWRDRAVPDTLYFTKEAKQTGTINGSPPADAVFRAKITYRFPPSETTSLADIRVTWPAGANPDLGAVPAGSVTSLIAVNR